jgi:hypothetical protein
MFAMAIRVADGSGSVITAGHVTCTATVGKRRLRALRHGFVSRPSLGGRAAACTWRVPRQVAGKKLTGTVTVRARGATVRKAFSRRVAR